MSGGGARIERQGALAILRLDKARGNAIDEPMAEALARAADEIASDDAIRGVLLASAHPKLFCPGLDLVALLEYERPAMDRFFARFEEASFGLYSLRKPLVAAVAGAAVAGGCILALTADHRVLRRGSPIGLNEVRVGLPLPGWVVTLLRSTVSPAALTRVALLGLNHTDEDAVEAGLVQEVLPADGFETAALARLEELASRDPDALGTTKGYLREATLAQMREQGTKSRSDFLDAWFAPAAQKKIRETVASLTRKV
ncbi:MAG: enoyl-CoA hydratase/isomerase family protein [Vicinamibacteria bacterium]